MARHRFGIVLVTLVVYQMIVDAPGALAQKAGGILKVYLPDSPGSMSILEESTAYAVGPMMGVFNNPIVHDQSIKRNRLETIRPDLSTNWSLSEDQVKLTFTLRRGVTWHDGKPFTAKDVECTWNLHLDRAPERLRVNPRMSSYKNLDRVTTNGDFEVTFHLRRPQPAFLMLLASGVAPIYPCHVSPETMRKHPIGTGPFKFVEYKPNQNISVRRNPNYWKSNRPYLDGIEYTIIRNTGTGLQAFAARAVDMTFPLQVSVPQLSDLRSQSTSTMCELTPGMVNRHIIMNQAAAPFDNLELRRAVALAIDRQAFIDILGAGRGSIGAVMQPTPGGVWGMPPDQIEKLPGYDPDVQKNRQQARAIMRKLGYGPSNLLKVKLTTRDIPSFRGPAVILLDQLKEIYIEGELAPIESAAYFPKLRRRDFVIGLNLQVSGPDPDPLLDIFYGCNSSQNWDGYCDPEVDKLISEQSMEADEGRRKQLVWAIERKLGEEAARPIIFYNDGATCWYPHVKGVTIQTNSFFNGYRYEDVWLDR